MYGCTSVPCYNYKPLMSMGVSHTNSRSVRVGGLGLFFLMGRGKLDGSGSVKTFDLTFLRTRSTRTGALKFEYGQLRGLIACDSVASPGFYVYMY